MSRKNDRERQKRIQRKREKRAAKRASQRAGGGSGRGGSAGFVSPAGAAAQMCALGCHFLFCFRGPLESEIRREVFGAFEYAGEVWQRVVVELEKFLCEGAPWALTAEDVAPLRRAFVAAGVEESFERLRALALTNAPDPAAAWPAGSRMDCAHRAAFAFHELWTCLDDPGHKPAGAIAAVVEEMGRHQASRSLQRDYRKLLLAAMALVRAPQDSGSADQFARDCMQLFEREAQQSETAWWQCGRVFLAEVFERAAANGHAAVLSRHPGLVAQLFDSPRALAWMARHDAGVEVLRSVSFRAHAPAWLEFFARHVQPQSLAFEDRLRYEIARLKLLYARGLRLVTDEDPAAEATPQHGEFLAAFSELHALLAHGVPPQSRGLAAQVEQPLIDFYARAVADLDCDAAAHATTETLLRRHSQDFHLACVYATGVLLRGERARLQALKECAPSARVDADLFARCAAIWTRLPEGVRAATSVRPLLFDVLDREHRKQCLLACARHALRRASSVNAYRRELRRLLPFFEPDNFIYRDLEEHAAVESGLVFLATMMAPFHGVRLALTEEQSRQWVSHVRELAQQSALGAKLAALYLQSPGSGFTLAPGVAEAARAALAERPRAADSAAIGRPADDARPAGARRGRSRARRKRRRSSESESQRGLFDA